MWRAAALTDGCHAPLLRPYANVFLQGHHKYFAIARSRPPPAFDNGLDCRFDEIVIHGHQELNFLHFHLPGATIDLGDTQLKQHASLR